MSQPSQLSFSLILPTCNRAELVKQFLESVSKQIVHPLEVIVVDQSDSPATKDIFDAWNVPGVSKKYIYNQVKFLILARHRGLDACASTDLVAFLDDDVVLDPAFCKEIVQVFEKDVEGRFAGGMGAVDGWDSHSKPFQAFFLMPHEGSGNFLKSGAQTFTHGRKEFCETEFLSGGCTFWRRKIIQQYRFDERLSGYGYGDDVDISFRISRRHKLFFQPKSVCFQQPNCPGMDKGRLYRRVWIQNMYYLAQKNQFFIPAFAWCVLGHFIRDFLCLDFPRVRGDLEGTWNILRGRVDTVVGYAEFKRGLKHD